MSSLFLSPGADALASRASEDGSCARSWSCARNLSESCEEFMKVVDRVADGGRIALLRAASRRFAGFKNGSLHGAWIEPNEIIDYPQVCNGNGLY